MKRNNTGLSDYGGIEGLPLQLMIVIIVATMGTAIIVGWMDSIETPHAISDVEFDKNLIETETSKDGTRILETFHVTVYDQDGNMLEGATIILDSNIIGKDGKTAYAVTGIDGRATFEGVGVNSNRTGDLVRIDVLVTKSGYIENSSNEIVVML